MEKGKYKFNDLTNNIFGKLTALKVIGRDKNRRLVWLCKCECGNTVYVNSNSLLTGNTKSCGCGKYGNNKKYGDIPSHHQRLYNIWCGIKDRCYNKKCKSYCYYGGRSISMCDEWQNDYLKFKEWAINNGYEKNLTIDRIDVNGNYSPTNCRWVDFKKQANNRTNSHYLIFNNERRTISEWADYLNIKENILRQRIFAGWSVERAITQPVRRIKNAT